MALAACTPLPSVFLFPLRTLSFPSVPPPPEHPAAGSAISSGVFVPMLLIGACLGRLVGLVTVDIAAAHGAGSQG